MALIKQENTFYEIKILLYRLSAQEAIRRNANYFTGTQIFYVANNIKRDYIFF